MAASPLRARGGGRGADRPARALGGEGGGRRARGRVRPAGGDAEEEARRGRRERVGRGGGALGRGERLRLVVAWGRSSPARRVPGGGEVLRAPGQGEVAGGGARGSGRRGRGGSDAGVDAREEETGGDAGADRAALVRDRVRGGFLGAPPRVVRFRRPRVGLVRRARRRFGRRGRCAPGGALGGAAGAGGARRARGGGGGGGRGEGSRRPRRRRGGRKRKNHPPKDAASDASDASVDASAREGRPRFEGLSPRFDVGRGRGARVPPAASLRARGGGSFFGRALASFSFAGPRRSLALALDRRFLLPRSNQRAQLTRRARLVRVRVHGGARGASPRVDAPRARRVASSQGVRRVGSRALGERVRAEASRRGGDAPWAKEPLRAIARRAEGSPRAGVRAAGRRGARGGASSIGGDVRSGRVPRRGGFRVFSVLRRQILRRDVFGFVVREGARERGGEHARVREPSAAAPRSRVRGGAVRDVAEGERRLARGRAERRDGDSRRRRDGALPKTLQRQGTRGARAGPRRALGSTEGSRIRVAFFQTQTVLRAPRVRPGSEPATSAS